MTRLCTSSACFRSTNLSKDEGRVRVRSARHSPVRFSRIDNQLGGLLTSVYCSSLQATPKPNRLAHRHTLVSLAMQNQHGCRHARNGVHGARLALRFLRRVMIPRGAPPNRYLSISMSHQLPQPCAEHSTYLQLRRPGFHDHAFPVCRASADNGGFVARLALGDAPRGYGCPSMRTSQSKSQCVWELWTHRGSSRPRRDVRGLRHRA